MPRSVQKCKTAYGLCNGANVRERLKRSFTGGHTPAFASLSNQPSNNLSIGLKIPLRQRLCAAVTIARGDDVSIEFCRELKAGQREFLLAADF